MKNKRLIIILISTILLSSFFLLTNCLPNNDDDDDSGSIINTKIANVSTEIEFAAALNNDNIDTINVKDGNYTGTYIVNKEKTIKGGANTSIEDITINSTGVSIDSININKVEVSSSVGEGDCKIQNSILNVLNVNGGGSNSISLLGNTQVTGNLTVNKVGVSVKFSGQSKVNNAICNSPCNILKLEDSIGDNITNLNINLS